MKISQLRATRLDGAQKYGYTCYARLQLHMYDLVYVKQSLNSYLYHMLWAIMDIWERFQLLSMLLLNFFLLSAYWRKKVLIIT